MVGRYLIYLGLNSLLIVVTHELLINLIRRVSLFIRGLYPSELVLLFCVILIKLLIIRIVNKHSSFVLERKNGV